MRISFDLSEADLQHFRLIMKQAQDAAAAKPRADVIAAAEHLLETVRQRDVPDFIRERLAQLEPLIAMVNDADWSLPEDEAKRVVDALCYFGEEDDLIPDDIPGVGFLDDAIMVELVVSELAHELSRTRISVSFAPPTSRARQPAPTGCERNDRRCSRGCAAGVQTRSRAVRWVCTDGTPAGLKLARQPSARVRRPVAQVTGR